MGAERRCGYYDPVIIPLNCADGRPCRLDRGSAALVIYGALYRPEEKRSRGIEQNVRTLGICNTNLPPHLRLSEIIKKGSQFS